MNHECTCVKDEDGRCESCISDIGDMVGRMLRQTISHLRAIDAISEDWSKACCICSRDNMDYALAKVAKTIFSDPGIVSDPKYAAILGTTIKQLIDGVGEEGPKKWPLTEKALLEVGVS